jgi:hypothetical protein
MPNKEPGSDRGEGKAFEDEPQEGELPRYAGRKHEFDEDTEDGFRLPKVTPEVTGDDDVASDEKKAGGAFEDQEIVIDEDEVQAESDSQPGGRKY